MVRSARIVLVLRFHCTLATPEPFGDWFQSTISTRSWTQTKVLAAYDGIKNSINYKTSCAFYTKLYISMFAKIVFPLNTLDHLQKGKFSTTLLVVQQSNHHTGGERTPFPPKFSLSFSKLHNCRVHLRNTNWELSVKNNGLHSLCLHAQVQLGVQNAGVRGDPKL